MNKNNEKSANWVILAPELTYEIIESRFSGCLVQEGAKGRFPYAGPIVMTFFHFVFFTCLCSISCRLLRLFVPAAYVLCAYSCLPLLLFLPAFAACFSCLAMCPF
jgi:hypothetical protein